MQSIINPGVGVTKTLCVNFSMKEIFNFEKKQKQKPIMFFTSLSYLTGVTAAELRWHQPNMNVIFYRQPVFDNGEKSEK